MGVRAAWGGFKAKAGWAAKFMGDFRCALKTLWLEGSSERNEPKQAQPALANTPAAPPTRAPKAEQHLVTGDADRGRSSDFRAWADNDGRSYYKALPKPPFEAKLSAKGFVSFPVTAAGQLRNFTGFPLRSSFWARHRNETQDIVFL
jgi:hypothetical protein